MLNKDDVLLQVNVFVYNVVQVRCLATGKCACVYNIVQVKKNTNKKLKQNKKQQQQKCTSMMSCYR